MLDVAYSEEREKEFDFNKETVLLNWGVIYVKKDCSINSLLDLRNKKIATMKESIHTIGKNGIIELLKSFNIRADFVITENYEKCFELLANNKVDAAVVNRLFGLENENKFNLKSTGIIFNPSKIKYAFKKGGKNSNYLITKIDENIIKFKQQKGSILEQSFNKYFISLIKKEDKYKINIKLFSLISFVFLFLLSSILFILFINKNKTYNYSKYLKFNPSMNIIRNNIINTSLLSFIIFILPLNFVFLYQGISIKWDILLIINFIINSLSIFIAFFIKKIKIIF